MNTQSQSDVFYSALSRRDSAFEGIFVVDVKTTGVFRRPTCSARMPKRENVEFFRSAQEALSQPARLVLGPGLTFADTPFSQVTLQADRTQP